MNTENSRTNEPGRFRLTLAQINLILTVLVKT